MKTIITFIFGLFITININSQSTPFLLKDSSGQEFVILSLDQARKLDNLSENKCTTIVDSLNSLTIIRNKELIQFKEREEEYKAEIELLKVQQELNSAKFKLEDEKKTLQLSEYKFHLDQKDKKIKLQSGLQKILIAFAAVTFTAFAISLN